MLRRRSRNRNALKILFLSVAFTVTFSQVTFAKQVEYLLSVLTADEDGAATDHTVKATIIGTNGSTKWFALDNPGSDDFQRGQWRYYKFTSQSSTKWRTEDIGWPTNLKLKLEQDGTGGDVCIDQLIVNYAIDGKHIDSVHFLGFGPDDVDSRTCLGDDEPFADDSGGAKMERTYTTWKKMPDRVAKMLSKEPLREGVSWEFICGPQAESCKIKQTETVTIGKSVASGWSESTQTSVVRTIEHTISNTFKTGGGNTGAPESEVATSLRNELSTSFTASTARTGSDTENITRTISRELTCDPPQGTGLNVYQFAFLVPFGAEQIKMYQCRFYCGEPPTRATTISAASTSCLKPNK
ncbi:PLAT/LH2 domain-containing protein [Marivita geojedonensis]|uniref:PLAT/LH2 domain-containing protein n=1 Tax=Marivita geojedonensis TaxID=1123756 RepID=UPI000A1F5FA3|nr:PLAT/LH2 domain-containing protein [Marivita geojedonensis]PRY77993.1 PLAT/LH2 domain-containing protein [Marivita geojedonensis]